MHTNVKHLAFSCLQIIKLPSGFVLSNVKINNDPVVSCLLTLNLSSCLTLNVKEIYILDIYIFLTSRNRAEYHFLDEANK